MLLEQKGKIMADIEYFYAAHSAYAFIGSAKFMAIAAAAGRRIVHRPVDLNQVLAGCGSTGFRERSLNYRNYYFNREIERWAAFRQVPTLGRRPQHHHHSPDRANKMIIAAMATGHNVDQLADRILVAHWAEDADHDDADTLISLAQAVGLDGAGLLAAAEDPAIAGQYQAFTDEAIERVVFGSPTYVVDGDMFYGQDHLEMLEQALQKPFAKTWPLLTQ